MAICWEDSLRRIALTSTSNNILTREGYDESGIAVNGINANMTELTSLSFIILKMYVSCQESLTDSGIFSPPFSQVSVLQRVVF